MNGLLSLYRWSVINLDGMKCAEHLFNFFMSILIQFISSLIIYGNTNKYGGVEKILAYIIIL